jgi:hypothetical protein
VKTGIAKEILVMPAQRFGERQLETGSTKRGPQSKLNRLTENVAK